MNTRNNSAYSGQFYPQPSMYQQQQQQYYGSSCQAMNVQPLNHHQAYALQHQSRQMYAPSPTCPSLYSLEAFPYAQQKLIPSQIIPPRVADYRPQPQCLQPPFQMNQPLQNQSVDPWYRTNNWQQQPQFASQPMQNKQPRYVDENDPFYRRPLQPIRMKSYEFGMQSEYQDANSEAIKDLKLIPASASQIPPHPSIQNSGVPLTDFAVDLIWEVCHSANEQALALQESKSRSRNSSEPSTPGQYGSIGGERAALARRSKLSSSSASLDELYFNNGTPPSYLSSPESPAGPLTPPSSTMSTACPIPIQFQNGKAEFMSAYNSVSPWLRGQQDSPTSSPCLNASPEEPSPTFRRFVKELLTTTLVTPQVLLLAMLYIVRIPNATREEEGWSKFLSRGVAYKMVLGALICANKHLDDNSFRCSTWATVSGCPIEDVAAAEAMVLKSLHFDLNVSSQEWSNWMQTLVERKARQNPSTEDVVLARLCALVDEVEDQIYRC